MSPERRIPRQTSAASADYDSPAERIRPRASQRTPSMMNGRVSANVRALIYLIWKGFFNGPMKGMEKSYI